MPSTRNRRFPTAAAAEGEARQAHKDALREVEVARENKAAAEKYQTETAARLSALEEAVIRLNGTCGEAGQKCAQAETGLAQLDLPVELAARLNSARAAAAQDRVAVAEANAELQTHLRDAETRAKRLHASRKNASHGLPAAIARAAKLPL